MTFNDLRKLVANLTTTDNVEQVGKVTSAINELEEASKKKDDKLVDISTKYIDLVKSSGHQMEDKKEEDDGEPQGLSLEDYADEVLK